MVFLFISTACIHVHTHTHTERERVCVCDMLLRRGNHDKHAASGSKSGLRMPLSSALLLAASSDALLREPLLDRAGAGGNTQSAPRVTHVDEESHTAASPKDNGQATASWRARIIRAPRTAWSFFGAVPILASYVATIPVRKTMHPNADGDARRNSGAFLGAVATLMVVRFLYTLLTTKKKPGSTSKQMLIATNNVSKDLSIATNNVSKDLSIATNNVSKDLSLLRAGIELVSCCTLFLLFCQDSPDDCYSDSSRRKVKTNGTFFSAMETFAEHAYTLPLLGACRLACASFRMDSWASSSHNAAVRTNAVVPVADEINDKTAHSAAGNTVHHDDSSSSDTNLSLVHNTTSTKLVYLDILLSTASPIAFFVLLGTLPERELGTVWIEPGAQEWLQALMFVILVSVYMTQGDFELLERRIDPWIRGGILLLGCGIFHHMLGKAEAKEARAGATSCEYYALRLWATGNEAGQVMLQVWMGLLSCR